MTWPNSFQLNRPARLRLEYRRYLCKLGLSLFVWLACWSATEAQEEIPYEFNPYRIRVWLSSDADLGISSATQTDLLRQVSQQLDIIFDAAANVDAQITPRSLFTTVLNNLDQFVVQDFLDNEFILVVARNKPEVKEVRTLETLIQSLSKVEVSAANFDELQREIQPFLNDPTWKGLADKLVRSSDPHEVFMKRVDDEEVLASLIRRSELKPLGRSVRFIPSRFPWQLDSLLKTYDKIFAVSLRRDTEFYQVQVREIDAVMRFVGPMASSQVETWESVPRVIACAAQQAFSPTARIEEADNKLAAMRIRAGGLILDEEHPAKLQIGDVLQPFVRRDDRNGVPTLLQGIPWTYVAMVESNGIDAKAAIYSGIRGALAGRKNRRTQKICLRVRPLVDATDLQLGIVRDPNARLAGAEVFRRTPGTEDLNRVGWADWRGISKIDIQTPPDAIYERPVEQADGETPTANDAPAPKVPPPTVKESVTLRSPLYIYYVKHGNTLLARLPIVTGLLPIERAELPDDRRRLESEAFVKGIQGEILDVVARRQILAARIKQYVSEKKMDLAKKSLEELRKEKSFETMVENLNAIQRRILSADRGPIPSVGQKRIDDMFNVTREMMQRYLQDSLLRDMDVLVSQQ
jgi:hypothetical protein